MNTLTQTIAISKETVAEMPVVECPVDITVVDTPELSRMALRELTRARVVGFDTETRPSFHRGHLHNVALMQLSTDEHCYLFRLNKLGISEHLRHFLEDPEVIKIGLSVHDDFSVMRRLVGDLDPQGFIDLQEYVKFFHINDISLQKIFAIIYGQKISKNQRLTNWEAEELTEPQQKYAAIDAWACLRLYRTLRSGEFHPDESPYIVDRSALNPAQNNQLIGPIQAAEQAKAAEEREKKAAENAQGDKPKENKRRRAARQRSKEAKAAGKESKAADNAPSKAARKAKPKAPKATKPKADETAPKEPKKAPRSRKTTASKTTSKKHEE